ncbi:Transcription factor spt8 [Xanthoria calcicola]
MNSFGAEEDDADSGALSPNGSSDNDPEVDVDGDGDGEADTYGDVENEDDNDDNEDPFDEQDQDDSQDPSGDTPNQGQLKQPPTSNASSSNNAATSTQNRRNPPPSTPTSALNPTVLLTSPSPAPTPLATNALGLQPFRTRPEALTASVYDIVPTIAAPHSTSINSITATPDLRWVFSGGADGYIRKFNWIDTVNGKSMLTVAQRHPFVDSVTKAGVLMSYWENEDSQTKATVAEEGPYLSSVYSLAVQREGLWLLSGLENGGINLQSVRHDEGKQIACLRQHTSAISALNLAPDERSLLSGSWDKSVVDWDLNTGQVKRKFEGRAGQISALEIRPDSSLPVPEVTGDILPHSSTFTSNGADKPLPNGHMSNGLDHENETKQVDADALADAQGSPADSLFGDSLFGDNGDQEDAAPSAGNFLDDDDNEFTRAIKKVESEQDHIDAEGDVEMPDSAQAAEPLVNGDSVIAQSSTNVGDGLSTRLGENASLAVNGLPHAEREETMADASGSNAAPTSSYAETTADSTFLAASVDGSLRIWDKRRPDPIARIPPRNVPPWCMNACWSPDGNFIYAGRRNGTVEEYSLHKGLREVERSFKLPSGSGPVSAVRAMPNGRHIICASYDILRLYDLEQQQTFKHSTVPFLIVPGHRTGVVSQLYLDPTCRYMISTAGNRGWEGASTEVLLGYEIGVGK